MNILVQLSNEHAHLHTHLERIQAAAEALDTARLRAALLAAQRALGDELDAHIRQEEAVVFTVASEALGDELIQLFRQEHAEVRELRDAIYAQLPREEVSRAAALRLCDLILAHQEREDVMLFPSVRAALNATTGDQDL